MRFLVWLFVAVTLLGAVTIGLAMTLEGIAAKRRDRPYRSGRSPDWIKIKNPDAPAMTRVSDSGG
jgi:hypothetical protein